MRCSRTSPTARPEPEQDQVEIDAELTWNDREVLRRPTSTP
jgi:hypothetical protein